VFERLQRALQVIETELQFESSERLGYITCCPTNLGVAMRASVHVKLPLLSQEKESQTISAIAKKYNVQLQSISGFQGVYDVSNRQQLGRSEKDLV